MTCDLYRFYDADERLLYVGISLHAAHRASEHRGDKSWWHDVARMDITHLTDRIEALSAERHAIITEHPKHNVVHKIPEPSSASDDGPIEFDFPYRMPELFAVQNAIDALGRRFDRIASNGQPCPSRTEFIGLVEAITRTVMYGDCCSECQAICHPIKLEYTGPTGCVCYYLCPEGHGPWTCHWTRDMNMLAMMP